MKGIRKTSMSYGTGSWISIQVCYNFVIISMYSFHFPENQELTKLKYEIMRQDLRQNQDAGYVLIYIGKLMSLSDVTHLSL